MFARLASRRRGLITRAPRPRIRSLKAWPPEALSLCAIALAAALGVLPIAAGTAPAYGASPSEAVGNTLSTHTSLVDPVSNANSAATTSLTLSGAPTLRWGASRTLGITWVAQGKAPTGKVTIQYKSGKEWVTLKKIQVTKGKAKLRVTPKTTTRYRAVTKTLVSDEKKITVLPSWISVKVPKAKGKSQNSSTLTIKYVKNTKLPASAKVRVQQRTAAKNVWRTVVTLTVKKGKANVPIAPKVSTRYRVVAGKTVSNSVKVTVIRSHTPTSSPTTPPITTTLPKRAPAGFIVKGSGFGHGIGMPQYGAYEMARGGKKSADILTHYYTGSKVITATTPATLSVQIFGPEPYSFGGYADTAPTATFSVDKGSWQLLDSAGKVLYPTGNYLANSAVAARLSVAGTRIKVTIVGGSGANKTFENSSPRLVWSGTSHYLPSGTKSVASLSSAQGEYRNGQLLPTVIGGKLNVVNQLTMQQYLNGIAEMPSSWGSSANKGAAALQAQAITARTFAYKKMNVTTSKPNGTLRTKCNCNLVDDIRDQNFTGWKKEGESVGTKNYGAIWVAAVAATTSSATSGQLVTNERNVPLGTYYFSSSGGRTSNSEDVWASVQSHLKSVPDSASLNAPGNSRRTWTAPITQARAAAVFGLRDIGRIEVTERYSSGQAKTLKATTVGGQTKSLTYKADIWRSKFISMPASWWTSID